MVEYAYASDWEGSVTMVCTHAVPELKFMIRLFDSANMHVPYDYYVQYAEGNPLLVGVDSLQYERNEVGNFVCSNDDGTTSVLNPVLDKFVAALSGRLGDAVDRLFCGIFHYGPDGFSLSNLVLRDAPAKMKKFAGASAKFDRCAGSPP